MKPSALLFLTSGLGDNLLTLPLALELEEKTDLTAVVFAGPQVEFFTHALPKTKILPFNRSVLSLFNVWRKGMSKQTWIYPIGACTRKVRLLHLLALHRHAIGFTSLNSEKSWQSEIGLQTCLLPNLAQAAWKNNLRLLSLLGMSSHRTWEDHVNLLAPRLKKAPRRSGHLVVHVGSAHYAGGIERYKRWPIERFVAVVEQLLSEHFFTDVSWVLGPDDMELEGGLTERIARSPQSAHMRKVSYREFKGSLLEMGTFLSSADYMLTNDSGLAHLATLYGVPLTSLTSGLGEPTYTGQNGLQSQVIMNRTECYGCAVGISAAEAECFQCHFDWACMDLITVDQVVEAVKTHAEKLKPAATQRS